jgi:alginate O-acetyltransferase complex protein AlgI
LRTYFNMFVTMVVSGIWHGAGWTFVIWGAVHALGRCLTRETEQTAFFQVAIPKLAKQLLVFGFVTFTWIFFRAPTLDDAWLIISRMGTTGWADPRFPLLMAALILSVWIYQLAFNSRSVLRRLLETAPARVGLAMLLVGYLLIVAQPSTKQFIYFQF